VARFDQVETRAEGSSIHLRFRVGAPGVIGWQLCDPVTGAYLFEGEWSEASTNPIELRIGLPEDDGQYQVRVAPVADRSRLILVDARVNSGRVAIEGSRVQTAAAMRWTRIRAALPKAFVYPVRSIWSNRHLIASMVRRDLLSRYKGSAAGAVWTFLNPLLLLATYFFVFGIVMRARFGEDTSRSGFVLYFLAGMLPWLAFAEAAGRSAQVVLEQRNLVKKLVFPVEILPVNITLAGVVTEAFALLIFLVFLLIARGSIPLTLLWLPVLLVPQVLLTVGLSWMLAALGVFFRDLAQIIGFLLQLAFFMTPILYPESQIPAAAEPVLKLNPMLFLVRGYRRILLENHAPDFIPLIALTAGGAALAIVGHAWFHRLRKSFADVI
jgi:lipopolysaccharide transport system permease protein